jgi:uncharacterized repeat protein (TIGR01451 family)
MWRKLAVSIGLSLILLGLVAAVRTGVLADVQVMPGKAQGDPLTNAVAFQQGPDAHAAAPDAATQPECYVVTFQQGVNGYRGCVDTRISGEEPNTNFGNQELILGMKGQVGTLIRFADLGIPCNVDIVSATLGLYCHNYDRPDDAGRSICLAYPVSRTWEEMEATWIKATNLDDWGREGCDDTTSDRSPISTTDDHEGLHERERWYTWDVSSAVERWVRNPASNQGLFVQQVDTDALGEYDIRESEWPAPELRPYLAVEYCLRPPPAIAVTKELVEPASGEAEVSETVTFALRITNIGANTINSLTVSDTYDSDYLTLISSSVEPDEHSPGIMNWTDSLNPFLPLAPGEGFDLTLDFRAEKATDPDVTTNTVTAWGVDECGEPAGPEEDDDRVKIIPEPQYQLYIPKVISCHCQVESFCSQEGDLDLIYRIDAADFSPYPSEECLWKRKTDCDLIRVISPTAPLGWNQPDYVPDDTWRPGSIVWWGGNEYWDNPDWRTYLPGSPTDPVTTVIGLETEAGEDEGKSGTTHLYRRWFDVPPPPSGMTMACAVLEMWSDNKSEWWWQGERIFGQAQNRRDYDLFGKGKIGNEGGSYLLAIQNSNDYAGGIEESKNNAHGTSFCLQVAWCNCPPQITRMLKPCQGQ